MYNKINSVFLKDSNIDSLNYYNSLVKSNNNIFWDIIVLTASNEQQANAYRHQIEFRLENNLLPKTADYIIISDPEGKRVGSGGATYNVFKHIVEKYNDISIFEKKKIMIVHSGGDSKRIPQYSACGKLFSPTPREIENNRASTLFDELMISFSILPSRMPSGVLILAGDILLLFNSLQIDLQYKKVAALSIKTDIETGTHHGVFLSNSDKDIRLFLHKVSKEQLINTGAARNGYIDIDTGVIFMDSDVIHDMLSLIVSDGKIDIKKFNMFVNDSVQLNFYGDFLYPMASEATLEQYLKEKAEREISKELLDCRKKIWNSLNKYRINIIKLFPSKFIHFGTTVELLEMMTKYSKSYEFIGWGNNTFSINNTDYDCALVNSMVYKNCQIGDNCYIENSILDGNTILGNNVIISNTYLNNVKIPDGLVISTLKLKNGKYVSRIYGVTDNPKDRFDNELMYMNHNLIKCFEKYNIHLEDIWDNNEKILWYAKLYITSDNIQDSVLAALKLYDIISCHASIGDVKEWLKCERHSLFSSFNSCDNKTVLKEQSKLENSIRIEKIIKSMKSMDDIDVAASLLKSSTDFEDTIKFLLDNISLYSYSIQMRIYYLLYYVCKDIPILELKSEYLLEKIFETIKKYTNGESIFINKKKKLNIINNIINVELPVRVNLGGAWSDTPPYCLENGGTVLNLAISLNGKLPIKVRVEKNEEFEIVLESIDYGTKIVLNDIKDILECSNPHDPFVLFKACLVIGGIIPFDYNLDLKTYLKTIGGGIHLISDVTGVPRGSGLGTSSILIGACLKALHKFVGEELSDSDICKEVLKVEQLMSTGGGWQDQVGGIMNGVKLINTKPGVDQNFNIRKIEIDEDTKRELAERFVIIYTGQRRLARNLLREIVLKYISSNKDTINSIAKSQRIAALMAFELEKGNIEEFAKLMNEQWNSSILIDKGSSNICIEQIINLCSDLISGKIIIGAGGGGFIGILLKKHITKSDLKERIQEGFQDSGVEVYDSSIIY